MSTKSSRKLHQFIKRVRAKTINSALSFVIPIIFKVNKILGNLYTSIWYDLNQSWFDHRFDYLRGVDNIFWYERGIIGSQKIRNGDIVLDIGSGDGLYSALFYSLKAKKVDAIDIDPTAISHSRALYHRKNISYRVNNILTEQLPPNKYNVIFLFAVIEHFSPSDGQQVLRTLKNSLKTHGVLVGSTPIFTERGRHNLDHNNEFISISALKHFLLKQFTSVTLTTSQWTPARNECYFECYI